MLADLKGAIEAAATGPTMAAEPGAIARAYRFDPGFPGFSGHFPGYPLLPAVLQIFTAACLIEGHAGRPLELAAVETGKFNRQIRPGEEIEVRCRRLAPGGLERWEARLACGGVPAASFTLAFHPGGAGR